MQPNRKSEYVNSNLLGMRCTAVDTPVQAKLGENGEAGGRVVELTGDCTRKQNIRHTCHSIYCFFGFMCPRVCT